MIPGTVCLLNHAVKDDRLWNEAYNEWMHKLYKGDKKGWKINFRNVSIVGNSPNNHPITSSFVLNFGSVHLIEKSAETMHVWDFPEYTGEIHLLVTSLVFAAFLAITKTVVFLLGFHHHAWPPSPLVADTHKDPAFPATHKKFHLDRKRNAPTRGPRDCLERDHDVRSTACDRLDWLPKNSECWPGGCE